MDLRHKKIRSAILSIFAVGVIMFLILLIPYFTSCNEKCFRDKYITEESIGTLVSMEIIGRSTQAVYKFKVKNKVFTTTKTPIGDFEQEGDQFVVLYESENPDNAMVLRHRPIKPDQLVSTLGNITYFKIDKKDGVVIVEFEYEIEGRHLSRLQFFSIDYLPVLESIQKKNMKIIVDVFPGNVNRAFLNVDKSI